MRAFLRALSFRMLALALILTLLAAPQALAATKYTTLEFGSRGSDVLQLQKALLELGFNPNGTDGKFGRGTETAVKAYQAARGLEVDGKAGTLTLTMLYGETSGESGTITTPVTTNPNTLKYGDSGSRVTELQTALVKLGYNTNGVDGRFGAGTQRAVISFQKDNGLEADGLAGTKTLELLYAKANGSGSSSGSSSGTSTGLTRTLRRGYTGDDVIAVQERLKELGYYTGSIDGVYGSGSIAAATAFQKNNGLKVDGLTGQSTYAALFSSSAVAAGSSGSSSSGSSSSSGAYVKLKSGDKGTEVKKRYAVATGTGDTPSPIGTFRITSRFSGDLGGFGTRFLGLNVPWGQFGIHGTNKPGSIGSNASHGCIRMYVRDSEELYGLVPNGAKVVIQGGPYGQLDSYLRYLIPGDRNSHVAAVQRRLTVLGYYTGQADGIYGRGTQVAVTRARKDLGLPVRDAVDEAFYRAIGLILFE